MSVNLVGQAPSGAVYRLRDATITVQGPGSTKVWNTETDPNRTTLSANVAVGAYSASLATGWRMERVEGPSTTTLPAELVSLNPLAFTVSPLERIAVPLKFRVFEEEIDLAQGYDIVLDVEECAAEEVCGDGLDNDCDGLADCADLDCAAAPACTAVCGNGVIEAGEACDDGNTQSLDGCSSQCLTEPSELEPNEDGTPSPGGHPLLGNDFATGLADLNGVYGGSFQLIGHIVPAGDEDVIAYENAASFPFTVRFDTWSSALGVGVPCGNTTDTAIVVRNIFGQNLAQNGDRAGPADRCSGLSYTIFPGERVYLQILAYSDNVSIPNYVLTVTATP